MSGPTGAALKICTALAVVALVLIGAGAAIDWVKHPFGLGRNALPAARAEAKVNGQQAQINADGAAINDSRAGNIARIHQTAQEARHAVQQTADYDVRLRRYLDGLDGVRNDGAAPIAADPADGGGHDPIR
ncbi:hypothetical protein [Caulobacter sp. Root343]|uniref:hypothetical protein n=1 Tax=Caulobacter sp. Root343 TaxID=1736520 RepID=UPI0006FBCA0D|nr:hypothetical protein [Caulobacter sp. Root343]KQV66655.1 hypothetical protein ASC70_12540 [Caulobacter sp. Root343]